MKRLVFALALGAGLASGVASAQQAPDVVAARTANPHGPGLKVDCTSCHGPSGWKPVRVARTFKHAENTFPLSGAHASATCTSCHKSLDFQRTPATCASCHSDVHKGELGNDCARCHTSSSFVDRSAMTRMHQLTRFPLRSAHALVACESCHLPTRAGQLQFVRGAATCASCHTGNFRTAAVPPHAEPAFSMNCTSCHTMASWQGARFDHSLTLFPLTGGHKSAGCADCHGDRKFHGKSMDCLSCHQKDYNGATNPPHAQGFPVTCLSCHTTEKWSGAQFDHGQVTRFPLTGAHRAATCTDCHGDKVFSGKSMECVACHRSEYDQTVQPKHSAAGFSTTCATCHNTTQWKGAQFDHAGTQFPLTGAHRAATCADCHADGVYKGKSTDCLSCHQANYAATTQPPHAASNISTQCATCHTTVQWSGGTYDHAATRFPLTGAHLAATCKDCHADGVYSGKPTTCINCHNSDWSASTNPHHAAAGFVTTCETCHTTTQWKGGTFNHGTTAFPLTGAHIPQPCIACHASKVYAGLPSTCVSCHLTDYNATTNPTHATAGFPTACQNCHTTTQWPGATFNHDQSFFPIYSGAHAGRWSRCSDCHVNPSNYQVFECITCHPHSDKAKTDASHQAQAGYQYVSTKCYACHPRGTH